MNKNTLTRLLLAAAMALPLLARAEEAMPTEGDRPHMAGPRGHFSPHGLPFLHGLELSESQEDKLFELMHNQAPYLREQERAHEKAMRALHEMRNAEKFDDAAAARLAQAAAQAQANLTLSHIRTHQKVLALLTPEQRAQISSRQQRGGFNER
ncbi:protein refolding chaperone Spy/CpxP family [Duganella sp. CF458]|uniref:Spy/CpxP family protein refolding chaperone n=1 Tax=Duganella sp. CF458 TaxID=1884368 RepID=UPI0008F34C9E|nr:Spy/CpxP family protein refolding chaperone [Duganella sp. CF458]SFG81292.1 protein refolding chaperone Spy/CpxP family [Duganella sp. CF458]